MPSRPRLPESSRGPLARRRSALLPLLVAGLLCVLGLVLPAVRAGAATSRPAGVSGGVGHQPGGPSAGIPVTGGSSRAHATAPRAATARSFNWAGYAVGGASGAYTSVSGSFVVPSVDCATLPSDEEGDSSYWVGLDGFGGATVEQIGVDSSCYDGSPWVYAWAEMYPDPSSFLPSVDVQAGDTLTATVTRSGGDYVLSLDDLTSGGRMTDFQTASGQLDASAECIAEDPASSQTGAPVPYLDYGSVSFTGCAVDGQPIGDLAPSAVSTVVGAAESVVASPGPLVNGGDFTVTRTLPPPAPAPGDQLTSPTVGIAADGGTGYWLCDTAGDVAARGAAGSLGSLHGTALNQPIVGMAATPDGKGYWLVAADGGIFAFGDARYYGSMGATHLNQPVVGMASTEDGKGYWLVAADGGMFAFGDAGFYGSMGGTVLNRPVVGMAAATGGAGYWLVASDGGIFSFGSAGFYGSMGGTPLVAPVVGMTADHDGYLLVAGDGGAFAFGGAAFDGSGVGADPGVRTVGVAADAASGGYWLADAQGLVVGLGASAFPAAPTP